MRIDKFLKNLRRYGALFAGLVLISFFISSQSALAARIKDVADLEGVRSNSLLGYGVVVGLKGTGDMDPRSPAAHSVRSLLARLGVQLAENDLRMRNVAAVLVTAELPPFARPGSRIDVTVSSMGDARSLAGGILISTPLLAADGQIYAMAQGALVLGGYDVRAGHNAASKNHSTVGLISNGASVERAAPSTTLVNGELHFVLRQADYTTAESGAEAIKQALEKTFAKALAAAEKSAAAVVDAGLVEDAAVVEDAGPVVVQKIPERILIDSIEAEDAARIVIKVPEKLRDQQVRIVASAESAWLQVDQRAVIVVNERTGTVVLGAQVHISPVAVAHAGLEIRISSQKNASQPNALAAGRTVVTRNSDVQVREKKGQLKSVSHESQGASVADLATALNALGATPRDLIAILQSLRAAGALQAEIVVQ